jgi:hypothetical protein
MSASTGTIQRPMGQGSILGLIAIAVAVFLGVGALAWVITTTATTSSVASVAAPHVSSTYVGSGVPVATAAPKAAPSPFDIDSAHTVPYVDRFAPIEPETPFDRAHRPAYVPGDR